MSSVQQIVDFDDQISSAVLSNNSFDDGKNMEYFICDSNGNDQEQLNLDLEFLRSDDLIRDPDSLSMISDYSEMGLQIKQSIKFSEMIMSTYSDLKNPSKSITLTPNIKPDPDLAFRKYNMLNLALEFSRWKECQPEPCLSEPLSDTEIKLSKDDSIDDTAMDSISPSILSDFSSIDQCLEGLEIRSDNSGIMNCSNSTKSPLQLHSDCKFDVCFSKDTLSSESDSYEEESESFGRLKITRPAWAQSLFHRDTLARMPSSIREFTNLIPGFDLSKDKYLMILNVSQLQLVMNSLMTQIEELNELLVVTLIMRDELRSAQLGLVVNVESLTMKARNLAQYWKISGTRSTHITPNPQNSTPLIRFFSSILGSQRATTSRLLSFFTHTGNRKVTKPEYV